jgi:hypothetical protein
MATHSYSNIKIIPTQLWSKKSGRCKIKIKKRRRRRKEIAVNNFPGYDLRVVRCKKCRTVGSWVQHA